MKNIFTIILIAIALLSAGCSPDAEETVVPTASKLVAYAENDNSQEKRQVAFNGSDILWFNEITKELRFVNNFNNSPISNKGLPDPGRDILFYLDDEYLFSAVYIQSYSSSVADRLVFYYDIMENKFYLPDGYPPNHGAQDERNKNMEKISGQWNKFLHWLKSENKYRN